MTSQEQENLTRVLVVGCRGVGKTSLARTIADGAFPSAQFLAHTLHDDKAVTIKYITTSDTAFKYGDFRECYHIELKEVMTLDPEACPAWDDIDGSHLIFLCFDITDAKTFEAIRVFYFPRIKKEIKSKANRPDLLLVGLKEDGTRECAKTVQAITPVVANALAKEIGAAAYVETSSLKHIGIDLVKEKSVFSRMVKANKHKEKMNESRCNLM